MEENEVVMEGSSENNGKNKKIIIALVALVVVILAIVGIVNLVKPTPEKTIKEFVKNMDDRKISEAFDQIDYIGLVAFEECDGDYEDFRENYKDAKEQAEDEDFDDILEEMIDGFQDQVDEVEEFSFELKDIKKSKKVKGVSNLYKVKAKIKSAVKEDEDSKTERTNSTVNFYVYKTNGKYKIVGVENISGDDLELF